MAIPAETDVLTWKAVAVAAVGLVQILILWFAKGFSKRLDKLEDNEEKYVTREEFEKHIARLELTTQRNHTDNKETMQRIMDKLERGGNTRHDIADGVHGVSLMTREIRDGLKLDRGIMREVLEALKADRNMMREFIEELKRADD